MYLYKFIRVFKDYYCFYKNNMVFIYTMRKVASTTLTNTLRNNGCIVQKQHCLNPINNKNFCNILRLAGKRKQHWLGDGSRFYRRLNLWNKLPNTHRLRVVSLVRDPLALNISDIFTQIYYEFPEEFKSLELNDVEKLKDFIVNIMLKRNLDSGLSEYFYSLVEFPKQWFDSELKEVLGIDVFKSTFAKNKGYQFYQGKNTDVLLIRSEDVNKVAINALNEFLGLNLELLDDRNVTNKMDGAELYRQVKSKIKFSAKFLDEYYAQSYANHFYDKAEIERFKSHWL